MALFCQSQLGLGAPDCPVVHRTVSGVPGWLLRTHCSREFNRRRTAIIHRTVRCAPDCPVSQRSAGPTVGYAICARHVAEPTVGRGHQTVRCALDCPVSQRSAGPTVGCAICARHVAEPTVGRGHQTVRCANGSQASTVGFATERKKSAPDSVRCAPDCPVRQATEGKNCLPGMHSTAPSCLGAIKGTPRRMEEYIKHSQSIPKH
jgi:hypothetical protein